MDSMPVTIKNAKNGKGCFASKEFLPGQIVYQVRGKLIDTDTIHSLNGSFADNCFRFDKRLYVSPTGEIGDYQNHSCAPNSKILKNLDGLFVCALKRINCGDEITIDYSTIVADDDVIDRTIPYEMICNCGEPNCRRIIGNFSSLPKELKDRYLEANAVPVYIQEVSRI